MSICEKCIVRGHVQGVFFRESTRREAHSRGITGYARNLADGTVEVLLCGAPEAVGHLKAWLWQGPPSAHVSEVVCQRVEGEILNDFTTE